MKNSWITILRNVGKNDNEMSTRNRNVVSIVIHGP